MWIPIILVFLHMNGCTKKTIVLQVKLYQTENRKSDSDSGGYDLRFNIGVREAIGIHGSEMGTADNAHH